MSGTSRPDDRKYSESDIWVQPLDNGTFRIGITDFAQDQLGEIIYVDLPGPRSNIVMDVAFGELESNKTVADLVLPLDGTILEINGALDDEPGLLNADPYGSGWLAEIQLPSPEQLDRLLSSSDYSSRRD